MKRVIALTFTYFLAMGAMAREEPCEIKILAFYSAKKDLAHISFVEEARTWLKVKGQELGYCFKATSDWTEMNYEAMTTYDLVIFLDSRPEHPGQREAFRGYMEAGGAWIGFHFAAFALTPSDFPQDWDWYHNEFLGSGMYMSNTWRPTTAVLRVEEEHPLTAKIPSTFTSAPNEWYRWELDLRQNPDIHILLSIDPESFPLGTGPKKHEIWYEGYYPVVWTNRNFRMVYFNMGHNDMDYEGGSNKPLSSTFSSGAQNTLLTNVLLWLATPIGQD